MEDKRLPGAILTDNPKGRQSKGRPQQDGGSGTLFSYNYAYATSRKAADSVPDEVIGFLN
jgi:hypothetical protein